VLEKTLYNYQRGGATLVEVLVAQRAASDVRLAALEALADRARLLVLLEQSAGLTDLLAL
jgi:outer membrane protein TolC